MTYTIEKIATLIGAHHYGSENAVVRFVLTDSRSLCFPEETLFFALTSPRADGHKYIPELYRRGVRSFVVSKDSEYGIAHSEAVISQFPEACFLQVINPLAALQRLAERHREEFDIPIVGITGSNGKTVVKEWLYQLLLPSQKITRSPRSYNSQVGVPLSVWLLNDHSEVGIFEAGISQPGEMQALHDIIQPTIGVFTHLGSAHQENFRSLEEKCLEKMQLFHDSQVVIYPSDNDVVSRCVRRSSYSGQRLGWSRTNANAPFYVKDVESDGQSSTIHYVYEGTEGAYSIPFIDEASIENSITSFIVALQLGLPADELTERMPGLVPVAMRLEVKEGQRGCTLINDSYNSDVNSLDIALDFMNRRRDDNNRHRTLILSDILQSGVPAGRLLQDVLELAVKRGVDKFIGIGEEMSRESGVADKEGLSRPELVYFFDTVESFIGSEIFRDLHDEVILLKGARQFKFERISDLLINKVHETILEVNLNAVIDNLNHYRSFLKRGTKMVCMIKADAYGSGAIEIAKTLQDHRVDYLAVAVADEGVMLRNNGITSNIIVMNPEMSSFKTLFDYELEPEVYSFRLLDALIKAARKEGVTNFPIHVKIDSGMHRLGFEEKDIDKLIDCLQHQTALIPRSVFSHFVGSDSDNFDTFSTHQFDLFDRVSRRLQDSFDHKILRHICNTAGIEHFPDRQLDMCRLGLGLYGVNPIDNSIINSVCTLKTTILQIRQVPASDTVGYSRKGVLSRDSVIAVIPIGYADGLNRHLGNRHAYCLVNGQKAPYVGNICMDVAMIDVTDIDCREGDTVEIFGDHLPVTVLSDALDTIPYEILTSVSNRVKRIYFQD